ncbi:PGAP1 family [Seminavis robusta]|uniref:GPI inositol-deacylase n=1 Tax=Seminavis robusta TaxID=568900 RepID=A0A9N8DEF3_9STRA|nr:PGAP1 family [Seminavis robusta]|eukprot:Sro80_g043090.1 PGAP1 family (534) ;mRNA; f:59403-61275
MVSATSVLNGVIGDYLDATQNELATPMMLLRHPDQPVNCSELLGELQQKRQSQQQSTPLPISVLVHGLVCDEHSWALDKGSYTNKNESGSNFSMATTGVQVDYGSLLERDCPDMTALYLRYNTGLHISTNGKRLSEILEALVLQISPSVPVQITLICHSMGGLLARSATQYALRHDASWIRATTRIIFLGTPHQGSYWECAGQLVTCALDYVPLTATRTVSKLAKLRSQGIQDLRYGYTLEEDWKEEEQGSSSTWSSWSQNSKQPGQEQLLDWVSYHAVTGTVMSDPEHPLNHLLGDGLVSKASAEGRSAQPGYTLSFSSKREFPGIHHNALQKSWEVYEQLREWIVTPSTTEEEEDPQDRGSPPKLDWTKVPCNSTTVQVVYNDQDEIECTDNGFVILNGKVDKKNKDEVDRIGTFARCRGVTALVQDAVDAGVSTVEHVQTNVTNEVYQAVTYVTPSFATPVVRGVNKVHNGIVSSIYSTVKYVNYGTGETVKCAFQTLDSVESLTWRMSRYLGYIRGSRGGKQGNEVVVY